MEILRFDVYALAACATDRYSSAGLPVVVGEWSCSTNLGAKQFTDLTDPGVLAHLRTLYANQMSLFSARSTGTPGPATSQQPPGPVGQHHWSLRMGSGWDPRPTAAAPAGAQAAGSAWNQSLASFPFAVWNLGDLLRVGVARPLAQLSVTGVCRCDGCSQAG